MRKSLLAAATCMAVLAGCATRQSDEWILRREFNIPEAATVITYAATPSESGWFGREGLKITMIFQLSDADFDAMARAATGSGTWQPLPIPSGVLKHLAGTRRAREARIRLARELGRAQPPEVSVYNPTDGQILERFRKSMPPHPRTGWYQIRTAGNDIMHAAKAIRLTLDEDVNDFMLAMLDPEQHTVIIRVSTNY